MDTLHINLLLFFFTQSDMTFPRGGRSLPLEAIPDAREKKSGEKGYPNQGWAAGAERAVCKKGVKIVKKNGKGVSKSL